LSYSPPLAFVRHGDLLTRVFHAISFATARTNSRLNEFPGGRHLGNDFEFPSASGDLGYEFPSEKNEDVLKKVLDSISNDRPDFASPVELWDSANRAPVGRRTISDGILLGHRDRLVWLLSVTWPEIGSGLLAANTPEKLS